MNRQIHQITILVVVMFLALSASLTSVQGLARPALWQGSSSQGTLTTDSRNSRTVYAEFGTDRGQIMVGDTAVADSVKSDDAYSYQRTYPGGELYAPVTGYFSTVFASMTGLERAENTVLNGQDPSLFSSRIKSPCAMGRRTRTPRWTPPRPSPCRTRTTPCRTTPESRVGTGR